MGRKPIPTRLKVLHGNPGKRPLPSAEPTPEVQLPDKPEHVTGVAAEAWDRFGPMLLRIGIITEADGAALELLALAYAETITEGEKCTQGGTVWIEGGDDWLKDGKPLEKLPKFVYSPYWVTRNKAEKKLLALLTEFGMTPSSRSKVTTAGGKSESKLSKYTG